MRNKCPYCNSCMMDIWIDEDHYLYCDFCRAIYTVQEAKFVRVTEEKILSKGRSYGIILA